MGLFRSRSSVAVAWGMIPLALWAGLPSTACVCANGKVKLVCRHAHLAASHESDEHDHGRHACCCEAIEAVEDSISRETDCCGGASCRRGAAEDSQGIGSQACCKPILAAPSVAPKSAAAPCCDQAPAVGACVAEIGALDCPAFARVPEELDTGPPLDRVIVFRSLLI